MRSETRSRQTPRPTEHLEKRRIRLLVGTPVRVPVEVIFVTQDAVLSRRGWVRWYDGDVYEIEMQTSPSVVRRGSRVVINFEDAEPLRVVTRVLAADGARLRLEEKRVAAADQRAFPRVVGGIPLRYHVLPPADDLQAARWNWVNVATSADDYGPWFESDPFMSFSVTGLAFEDTRSCREADTLLVEMGVGEHPERWRATAKVVRVEPIPRDDRGASADGATHRIAVEFIDIPRDAVLALEAFTLKIQRAVL